MYICIYIYTERRTRFYLKPTRTSKHSCNLENFCTKSYSNVSKKYYKLEVLSKSCEQTNERVCSPRHRL